MTGRLEGWGRIISSAVLHYYRGGWSVCRRVVLRDKPAEWVDNETYPNRAPYGACRRCLSKLKREAASHGNKSKV